jgi:hypothetical protein
MQAVVEVSLNHSDRIAGSTGSRRKCNLRLFDPDDPAILSKSNMPQIASIRP